MAAAKGNDSAFELRAVKVDPAESMIYGSNGHCLYWSRLEHTDDEFPDCAIAGAVASKECVLIPADKLEKAFASVASKSVMLILQCVQVLTDETHHHLVTTDCDTVQDMKVKHCEYGDWPAVKQIRQAVEVEREKGHTGVVGISLEELERLVKMTKKLSKGEKMAVVELEINMIDMEQNPIGVKLRHRDDFGGLIMPCLVGG
jgi:hypothetical protein